ncbi:MAG TPA: Clp protease N-terminal domain-containing protein [Candidatus Nanoarchaeia archaeon]|nr:Clp protease N-terminal domain-containing protein [Candidatus Nanoarchaeia archaeon]
MALNFSKDATKVIKCAAEKARQKGHETIETAHILFGIIRIAPKIGLDDFISNAFYGRPVLIEVESRLGRIVKLPSEPESPFDIPTTSRYARTAIYAAVSFAEEMNSNDVHPMHLLYGLLDVDYSQAEACILSAGADPERVREVCRNYFSSANSKIGQ